MHTLRYATAEQIRRVIFAGASDHKGAYTRLRSLFDGGYLDRERPPSVYQPDPYRLTMSGYRKLKDSGRLADDAREWRASRITDIPHYLAITEIWAILAVAAWQAGHTLGNWQNDLATHHAFTYYHPKRGREEKCILRPDSFFTYEYPHASGVRRFNAFLEADRKTEATSFGGFGALQAAQTAERTHNNVITAKAMKYLAYHEHRFKERYGLDKFRVLFAIESPVGTERDKGGSKRRARNMKEAVEAQVKLTNPDVSFWFTTIDQLKEDPLGDIWWTAGKEEPRSLILKA